MNFYEILGVSADATDQQIKDAYRREAMKWHPDRHEGEAAKKHADKRFKDLAVAYRALRDPAARDAYDQAMEQTLRDEYNARQREQARERQEKAQSEQAKQQQQQNQSDFANASSEQSEDGMSGNDANQMFFEQMLDLAFELAGREFPEPKIVKALVTLGCPESMAKAVAAVAIKKTAQANNKDTPSNNPNLSVPITNGKWEEIEPYFLAFITGKTNNLSIPEDQYKSIRKKYIGRLEIAAFLIASIIILSALLASIISLIYPTASIAVIILIWFISNRTIVPAKYYEESRRRSIIESFRDLHSNKIVKKFNFYAFFFNIGWLFYRKMYLLAFFGIFIYIAINLTGYFYLNFSVESMGLINLLIPAILGIFSYRLYYTFAEGKINNYIASNKTKNLRATLAKKYGYSSISAIIGVIFTIIIYSPVNIAIQADTGDRLKQQSAIEEKERTDQAEAEAEQQQREAAEAQRTAEAQRMVETEENTREENELNSVLVYIEKHHPELFKNNPTYDAISSSWVAKLRDKYMGQGLSNSAALRKSIDDYELELNKLASQNIKYITDKSSHGNYKGTGELVSLSFQNIEIRALLKVLSDFTKLAIIADDEITGSVSLRLLNTRWDEALSKVLYYKNWAGTWINNSTLYIHPPNMSKENVESRAAQKIQSR